MICRKDNPDREKNKHNILYRVLGRPIGYLERSHSLRLGTFRQWSFYLFDIFIHLVIMVDLAVPRVRGAGV